MAGPWIPIEERALAHPETQLSVAQEAAFRYYGAKASINVWEPHVEATDFSSASMWIMANVFDAVNTIEVGWMVHPILFGDNNARLFTYWTGDGYHESGCYNLLCPGFVQTNKDIVLGGIIRPISIHAGQQYEIEVYVYRDQKTGYWWLQFKDTPIGYWPGNLFPILQHSASLIEWGGEVYSPKTEGPHTTTGMGAGQFPGPYGYASFFKDLKVMDNSNVLKNPEHITTNSDQPSCYRIDMGGDEPIDPGVFFYFGGPGRNPNCP